MCPQLCRLRTQATGVVATCCACVAPVSLPTSAPERCLGGAAEAKAASHAGPLLLWSTCVRAPLCRLRSGTPRGLWRVWRLWRVEGPFAACVACVAVFVAPVALPSPFPMAGMQWKDPTAASTVPIKPCRTSTTKRAVRADAEPLAPRTFPMRSRRPRAESPSLGVYTRPTLPRPRLRRA